MKNCSIPASVEVIHRAIRRFATHRFAWLGLVVPLVLVCAAFAGWPASDDEARSATRAAIDDFWTAYHGNNYSAIPQVETELQHAVSNDPDNPTLYALLGAAHFWHIGEAARDPNPHDPALGGDMPAAVASRQHCRVQGRWA